MLSISYLVLLFVSVVVSFIATLINSVEYIVTATWISVAVGTILLLSDALLMWRRGGIVGRLVVNFGVFYWFWLGAWHASIQSPPFPSPDLLYNGFGTDVPEEIVAASLLGINLFAFMAMVGWGYIPQPQRLIARLADRFDPPSTTLFDLLSLGLASSAWIALLIAYQGDVMTAIQDLLLMRAGGRVGPSVEIGLLQHLHLLGVFGASLALARVVLNLPGLRLARYSAIALMLPILFFGEGSRFNLAYLLLPAVLILMSPARQTARWKSRRAVLIVLVAIGAILILYQGAVRTVGLVEARKTDVGLQDGLFGNDHFGAMMIAVDFADKRDFYMELMTPYFITHFIPRIIWENKPYPQSWLDYNAAWTQGRGFNVTPSITGQYYLNWGYLGVIYIGGFIGWLSRFCEVWFARLDIRRQLMSGAVAGLLLGFVFLSFRFFYPLYFAYPLFGYFAYFLLSVRKSGTRIDNRVADIEYHHH